MHFRAYFVALVMLISIWTVSGKAVRDATEACYGDLGCFHAIPPLNEVAISPTEMGTQFLISNRGNQQQPIAINATFNESTWQSLLSDSHFDVVKVLVHGWQDTARKGWMQELKDELLKKDDFQIIQVDWSTGAKLMVDKAAANVFLVAAQVAKFLNYLVITKNLDLAKVHMIGHSFGAQTIGLAGSKLGGAVGRVTGLDPAQPYFKDFPNTQRLDRDDGQFVDIIHTDAEDFDGTKGYGLFTATGHADFYPNGGVDQPGCTDDLFQGLAGLLGGRGSEDSSIACSHSRAHAYFIDSINATDDCKFIAHPCASWDDYKAGNCYSCPSGGCPVMGYNTPTSASGTLYLTTTMKSPFCGYEYVVEMDLTDNVNEDSFGKFFITLLGNHNSDEAEFSRDDVHYSAGNTETQLLAVNRHVGTVTGVKVRFHHNSGLFGFGTDKSVYLHRVNVRDPATGDSFKFCTNDAQLIHDQPQTFTSNTGC